MMEQRTDLLSKIKRLQTEVIRFPLFYFYLYQGRYVTLNEWSQLLLRPDNNMEHPSNSCLWELTWCNCRRQKCYINLVHVLTFWIFFNTEVLHAYFACVFCSSVAMLRLDKPWNRLFAICYFCENNLHTGSSCFVFIHYHTLLSNPYHHSFIVLHVPVMLQLACYNLKYSCIGN